MSTDPVQESLAFGEPPSERERYLTRRDGTLDREGDPACWAWPVPEAVTFRDDKAGEAFLEWWNRCCAICGDSAVALVKDHDHDTMDVRGFLCTPCNVQEGKTAADAGDVFARYRERSPAVMLGVSVRYQARPAPVVRVKAPPGAADRIKRNRLRLAEAIRAAREQAGLSQADVARRMKEGGFPQFRQQTIVRIEWAKRSLGLGEAYELAEILGMAFREMCEATGDDYCADLGVPLDAAV